MNARLPGPGQKTFQGTLQIFIAESLIIPSGILVTAFLTHRLGPDGYGFFILVASVVASIEWAIGSMFARASIKLVSDAADGEKVGSFVMRVYFIVGLTATVFLWFLSPYLSRLFNEPRLISYLQLFALDIPLFTLARVHRNILIGVGRFQERATASAGRWLARLAFIVVLVECGFSIEGAILGSIGASLVELLIGRYYVRPPLLMPSGLRVRGFWAYGLPLMFFSVGMHFFQKLDLFALKVLGASVAEAGIYGAAQNIALLPGLLAVAFSPLVLSNLNRALRMGEEEAAKALGRHSMRLVIALFPFATLVAGSAQEIVVFIFGREYSSASSLVTILIFAALASLMISVGTAILTAAGRAIWTSLLSISLVGLAALGHLLVIPVWGAVGAALVTFSLASFGGLAVVLRVYFLWKVAPPLGTCLRSVFLSPLAYLASVVYPLTGILLVLKLSVMSFAVLLGFRLLREFNREEIYWLRSAIRNWTLSGGVPTRA